jgi:hypothetical protein
MTCPYIKTCEKEVTHSQFRDFCCTSYFIYCSTFQEMEQKDFKKPREWMQK